jgi:hypothetical protein
VGHAGVGVLLVAVGLVALSCDRGAGDTGPPPSFEPSAPAECLDTDASCATSNTDSGVAALAPSMRGHKTRDDRIESPSRMDPPRLLLEIEGLLGLFRATRATSKDRPAILRRLAEDWVELEKAYDRTGQSLHAAQARTQAVDAYARLAKEYPSYVQLDQVLYYLGLEYERAGKEGDATATYADLERRFPQSRFVGKVPSELRSHERDAGAFAP